MSAATERQFNPSELSDSVIERIALAIAAKMGGFVTVRRMSRKEAIDFTGYSESRFDTLVSMKKFRAHRPEPKADPVFFPDELIEDMKNWNS